MRTSTLRCSRAARERVAAQTTGSFFACGSANWHQADAEINRTWTNRAMRYAKEFHPGSRVSFHAMPLQKGQTADLRPKAMTLMIAAGLILLITCANLAGLTVV